MNDLIDQYFKMFKLDSRASQTELELAYDVLTRGANISTSEIQGYRLAFEYLMSNFYNRQPEIKEDDIDDIIEEDIKCTIKSIPAKVKDALDYSKKFGVKLSEAARITWSTQNVNLPLFFCTIKDNFTNILGLKFFTVRNMWNICKKSIMNPLDFKSTTFEMSNNYGCKDLQMFVKNLQKSYKSMSELCCKFDVEVTEMGVTGFTVLEKELNEQLINILRNRAEQLGDRLNLVTSERLDDDKYEQL